MNWMFKALVQNSVALLPDLLWMGGRAPVRLVDLPGSPVREVFTAARRSSADRPVIVAVRGMLARAVAP